MTDTQQRHGMRMAYLGQAFGTIQAQILMGSAIGVLLIKHLGGSDLQAMLLVPLLLSARVLQIPISLHVRPSKGKRFMLNCWLVNGLAVASAIGVTGLPIPNQTKILLMVGLFAAGGIVQMCGLTFWLPLLHDIVPERMRGRFFGRLRTIWSATSFVAMLLAGLFLGKEPELWRFQVVLGGALGLYLMRNLFIAHLPEPDLHADDNYSDWKRYVKHILSRREVIVFCVYFSLLSFAAGFLNTPLVLYMKHMGFNVSDNVIVFSFRTVGQMCTLLVAGWLADRIGTKRVFLIAHLGLCAVCVAVIGIGYLPLSQAFLPMLVAMIASGAMLAMAGVACTAQLFHLAPDHGRAFFMSLAMILVTYGAALSPILAGAIQEYAANLTLTIGTIQFDAFQIMLGAAAAGMLLLLIFLASVEDIRNPRS
jgi:MFS family permease